MKWIEIAYVVTTAGALGGAAILPFLAHRGGSAGVPGWQAFVTPGPLSRGHAFLGSRCEACHTPHQGPTADKCVACHAADEELFAAQTTRFHATVPECNACHPEHLGEEQRPVGMRHEALPVIARRATEKGRAAEDLAGAIRASVAAAANLPLPHDRITRDELLLDCMTCHAHQDPHRQLLGRDCGVCHSTALWTIPEFRHPSPVSTECAQCHQAPPGHYMHHFHMVSMNVAGIMHAEVRQCFLCHKTNAWNDIQGVGWYKHH